MQRRLFIKSKPFSVNAMNYSDARTKTQEFWNWTAQIFNQLHLKENQQNLKDLREYFDESKHSVKLIIDCIYPKSIFVTKSNVLSSKTFDVSNVEKPLIDLIFDEKYSTREHPNGAPNLCINDKHVVSMLTQKSFHEQDFHLIKIKIKIVRRTF